MKQFGASSVSRAAQGLDPTDLSPLKFCRYCTDPDNAHRRKEGPGYATPLLRQAEVVPPVRGLCRPFRRLHLVRGSTLASWQMLPPRWISVAGPGDAASLVPGHY